VSLVIERPGFGELGFIWIRRLWIWFVGPSVSLQEELVYVKPLIEKACG